MTGSFVRIDRRETHYQFDAERDVPWHRAGEPGAFATEAQLQALGVDVAALNARPALADAVQVCFALATCDAFARLEEDVVAFLRQNAGRIPPSRSADLLAEEEVKHAALFRRFGAALRARRPEVAALFDRCYRAPTGFGQAFPRAEVLGCEASYQHLFWRNTIFFEEYTVHFCDRLEEAHASGGVQPCWLALHRCHRREEVQHLVTDAAYLAAVALGDERKEALGKLFQLFLREHFDRYFAREVIARVAAELAPGVAVVADVPFESLPIAGDLRAHRAFRRTRASGSVAGEVTVRGATLIERLVTSARTRPDAGVRFVEDDGTESHVRYGELLLEARALAAALAASGVEAGATVVLQLLRPRDLVPFFWACLARGAIPVPLSPPMSLRDGSEEVTKLLKVHRALGRPCVVVDDVLLPFVSAALASDGADVAVLSASALRATEAPAVETPPARPGDLAFVQFSSGSVGDPRGVGLTHANVLAECDAMVAHRNRGDGADDTFVSWIPLYHDMGLIGYHLTPAVCGAEQVILTPLQFIRQPFAWIERLSMHRATVTGAPNFALARVLAHLEGKDLGAIDLSALHTFLVGAEPVAWKVLHGFTRAFAASGLREETMCPGYGLAEATLAVTMLEPGRVAGRLTFARQSLRDPAGVRVVSEDDPEGLTLVDVGQPVPGVRVRITSERGEPVAEGVGGTIEVAGPTVMPGYHGEAVGTSLRGEWLDTGDLGVLHGGRLYVTGRKKDVFFIAGKNHYAHDVEAVAREVAGVRPGYVALVIDWDDQFGVDELLLFVACEDDERARDVLAAVHDHVRRRLGLDLDAVLAIDKRSFTRTTSGKLQRYRLLERYRAGTFDGVVAHHRAKAAPAAAPPIAAATPIAAAPPIAPAPDDALVVIVRTLWSKALGVTLDAVHEGADFRALGGTSILAAEIHGKLEAALGKPLPLEVLVKGTTPARLAAAARDAGATVAARAPEVAAVTTFATFAPVAVIAAGVRVPGARGMEAFTELLAHGTRIGAPPARWGQPAQAGEPPATGAFLDDVEQIDAEVFGLRAEEARRLDPQQRVFLEVALDALGGARSGSRVGVFVGAGDNEYAQLLLGDEALDRHALLGTLANMSAARVAQVFGLTGPALTVNTACSSSLVAVHQACRALQDGDCDVALAGGVQVNLTDRAYRYFRDAGLLSKTGECRPFDEDAAGLVPGEGAGAVLLKPLARALADGDPILAVIRGSAVNNDGGSLSSTAPNAAGQKDVLRRAYASSGISPRDIGYVEAHAAGTAVGDAIEAEALGAVLADAGRATPCAVGSVKGHLGHTLSAAGILGLLKAIAALRTRTIPPTAGCRTPARRIDFARAGLEPVREARALPAGADGVLRAGVSAFGLGGTNAHVVLEEAPRSELAAPAPVADVLCIAAPSGRIAAQAAADRDALRADPRLSLREACAASAVRHALLGDRAALVVKDRDGLVAELDRVAREGASPSAVRGKVVLVFPGPGAQCVGMGRSLLASEPAFRAAFHRCAAIARAHGMDLARIAAGDAGADPIDRIDVAQPVTFAFGYALACWLGELGVRPDLVMGHSAGEYAAACVAGVLTLEDALRLVIARGRAMADAPLGAMAAIFAPSAAVAALLATTAPAATIAAYNGPAQTVIAGPESAVRAAIEAAEARAITARPLRITCAAHSKAMDSARTAFARAVRGTAFAAPTLPLISTRTGALITALDEAHWLDHLCDPVRFGDATQRAFDEGGRVFVEAGASGGLSWCIDRILGARRPEVAIVSLLRGDDPSGDEAVLGLAALYEAGVDVRFERRGGRLARPEALLPLLPFTRARHWVDGPARPAAASRSLASPALASRDPLALDATAPAVRDHVTRGVATAPAALLVDRLLARELRHGGVLPALRDVVVVRPLAPPPSGGRLIIEVDGDRRVVRAYDEATGALTTHAQAVVAPARGRVFGALDLAAIGARCPRSVAPSDVYATLDARGFVLGTSMRCLDAIHAGDGELLARLALPVGGDAGFALSPALLDAAAQSVVALALATVRGPGLFLGFGIGEVTVHAPVGASALAYVRLVAPLHDDAEVVRFDIVLASPDGVVLAEIRDFSAKRVTAGAPLPEAALPPVARHEASPSAPPAPPAPVPDGDAASAVSAFVRAELARCLRLDPARIPSATPLSRLGVDSLMAVEVLTLTSRRFSTRLSPTLLFEHRTLDALARAVASEIRRARG